VTDQLSLPRNNDLAKLCPKRKGKKRAKKILQGQGSKAAKTISEYGRQHSILSKHYLLAAAYTSIGKGALADAQPKIKAKFQ
jgi:hypothetical protein